MASSNESKKNKSKSSLNAFIIILVIISLLLSLSVIAYTYFSINQRLNYIQSTQDDIYYEVMPLIRQSKSNNINLTEKGWQELNYGLRIADISVTEHLTGVIVKGRIINTLSVNQSIIKFSMNIGSRNKIFEVTDDIKPGCSAPFEVYIPDVPIKQSNYASIKCISSYINFN